MSQNFVFFIFIFYVFFVDRTWTSSGLQSLSDLTQVLGMNINSSNVTLQTAGFGLPEQSLVFRQGQFWNPDFSKVLSINDHLVKADTNDTRGAVSWAIGWFMSVGLTLIIYIIFAFAV
jgi:hypothetical protein